MHIRRVHGLVLAAVVAGPGALSAQLAGRVREEGTGAAIPGVALRLIDAADRAVASTLSTDSGTFALAVPASGRYRIEYQHLAYGTARVGPLTLRSDSLTTVTLRLAPEALPLDALTIEVEARSRRLETVGYYERRALDEGHFIDRATIERRPNLTTADVLGRAPGTRIFNAGTGKDVRLREITSFTNCLPTIYLNGLVVAESDRGVPMYGPPRFDLEALPADDVEAIEVYPGSATVPLQYGGTMTPCGALLIWTRE